MSAPFSLFSFPDTADLAEATASRLGLETHLVSVHPFPDGESLIRASCDQPGRAILFRTLDRPNEKLVELLLAADALRRQGIEELVLVAPYLGYMRQDRVFHTGEPISQRVVARMLDSAFDEIITIEAHLHRIKRLSEIFSCRAESYSAAGPIARWLQQQSGVDLIVGPDSESEPWIRSIAERAQLPWIVGAKTRYSDRRVEIEIPGLPAGVRSAWVVDDIASSGATLETIARALACHGVKTIGAVTVHPLFEQATLARLAEAGIERVVSTNSIVHPTNAIDLAPFLAEIISSHDRSMEAF